MQTFEIETPDGRKFRIEAPDGATQEQVMAFVQQSETARAERIAAATAAD